MCSNQRTHRPVSVRVDSCDSISIIRKLFVYSTPWTICSINHIDLRDILVQLIRIAADPRWYTGRPIHILASKQRYIDKTTHIPGVPDDVSIYQHKHILMSIYGGVLVRFFF